MTAQHRVAVRRVTGDHPEGARPTGVAQHHEGVATQPSSLMARDVEVGIALTQCPIVTAQKGVEIHPAGAGRRHFEQPLAGRTGIEAVVAPVQPVPHQRT